MKNSILLGFCFVLILTTCYEYEYENYDTFQYLGFVKCDTTKFAILRLQNTNKSNLPKSQNDTLTLNGKFYKDIYFIQYYPGNFVGNDPWTKNTKNDIYSLWSSYPYTNNIKCKSLSHLTFLSKTTIAKPLN